MNTWNELTKITKGEEITVEKVRLKNSGIAIEGQFEIPSIARLDAEDQVFVAAFIQSHGSIKQMEKFFGVSYPTIKSRLNKISEKFDFMVIEPVDTKSEILEQLDRGEITVEESLERLQS